MSKPRRQVSVNALLAAVTAVPGVRDARVNTAAGGEQTLQLDLIDGADELAVAQQVARILDNDLGYTVDTDRLGADSSGNSRETANTTVGRTAEFVTSAGRSASSRNGSSRLSSQVNIDGLDSQSDAEKVRDIPGELAQALAGGSRRRIQLDRVQVTSSGLDCEAEVALHIDGMTVVGKDCGPATGRGGVRAAAGATACALDDLLDGRGRVAVDYAGSFDVGNDQVVMVLATLVVPGHNEQLPGVALVRGDARQAAARAMLAAVDRRLVPLLENKPASRGDAVAGKTALVPILAEPLAEQPVEEPPPATGRHSLERANGAPWYQRQLPAPRNGEVEIVQSEWA